MTSSLDTALDRDAGFDVIVVGAGFAGLYMLHRLHGLGMSARVYEQGDGVGGTWYWNRYPGARCDAESLAYSFSFSSELEQEWEWSERYAPQAEILAYADHVADRFDLRRDIRLERTVCAAHFDDEQSMWTVKTEQGDVARARFVVMATGCLSVPQTPDIEGLDDFRGPRYQTGQWPHEGVDFSGQRVGIIGTGSSAVQAIPVIAEQAEQLTVFQRTPNFSVPAFNHPLDPEFVKAFKQHYPEQRKLHREGKGSGFGDLEAVPREQGPILASTARRSEAELRELLERYWRRGGACFMTVFADALIDRRCNDIVAGFVRDKIREAVTDPAVAQTLCPTSHPVGTKRICVDSNYYETYNRENVSLVDLRKTPIERITPTGLETSAESHEFDRLVLATGFDAMTGALLRMDIRGAGGVTLAERWSAGPRSYLGIAVSGFPNLFTVTGPGSPSVLSNMLISIEQHVDFMVDCISQMRDRALIRVEAERAAEDGWVAHVNEVADATLYPEGGSWYLGANVPGKPRVFMPYAAGVAVYREICDRVALKGYEGFRFSGASGAES
jgi:cyclohexanone monooxygenase